MEESNRLAIGALGAIPPLLDRLCGYFLPQDPRVEAALALHNLSSRRQNLEVLLEEGGVVKLMRTAMDRLSPMKVRKQALILMQCAVGARRGMEEVMEGGGIEMLLRLSKEKEEVGLSSLMVMYALCNGESSGRFLELARAMGGETVLMEEGEEWGDYEKDMAKGLVSALRRESNPDGDEQVTEKMKEEEDKKGKKKVSFD